MLAFLFCFSDLFKTWNAEFIGKDDGPAEGTLPVDATSEEVKPENTEDNGKVANDTTEGAPAKEEEADAMAVDSVEEPINEAEPDGKIVAVAAEDKNPPKKVRVSWISMNEDELSCTTKQYFPHKFVLLEALSATGLRSIRYAKEIPLVK